MFSGTIFKQTLRSNYLLWIVFSAVMAVMGAVVIAVYDPKMIASMMSMIEDMPGMASMIGDRMDGMTSLLGMLGESFYGMQATILAMIFVIMTANTLVAAQVDRGSMAYILSTPIKRAKVVRTQALYLITSLLAMFILVTGVGMASVQVFHHGLWGTQYTTDVRAAAEVLELDDEAVANHLGLIVANDAALKAGAEARGIDPDVYSTYLNLKLTDRAYAAAAEVLGVEPSVVAANPALILADAAALQAAAEEFGLTPPVYGARLEQQLTQLAATAEQSQAMQNGFLAGLSAAAAELDMEASDLATDLGKLAANPKAMAAAVTASGLPEEVFTGIINQQLASDELTLDRGIEFDVPDYLLLNLGAFLLMFAIGGIAFLFSCVFNLSRNSLALGAGLPVAFFIFQIMAQASANLEGFKYVSLNTLFAPAAITSGGTFWPQFAALAVLGTVLYAVGAKVFVEKDLPL